MMCVCVSLWNGNGQRKKDVSEDDDDRDCYTQDPRDGGEFDDDVEVGFDAEGGRRVSEGDFHIDSRGDGTFSTAAARCLKAVIHR